MAMVADRQIVDLVGLFEHEEQMATIGDVDLAEEVGNQTLAVARLLYQVVEVRGGQSSVGREEALSQAQNNLPLPWS